MSWGSSRRKERFNPGWEKRRREILERDSHRCQHPVRDIWGDVHICGAPARQVDHKMRATNGVDDDSDSNLWALCDYHHELKTCDESADQRRLNKARRKEREWYSHPAFQAHA